MLVARKPKILCGLMMVLGVLALFGLYTYSVPFGSLIRQDKNVLRQSQQREQPVVAQQEQPVVAQQEQPVVAQQKKQPVVAQQEQSAKAQPKEVPREATGQDSAVKDNSELVVSPKQVQGWSDEGLLECLSYREFRAANFLHPTVAKTICQDGFGFRRRGGVYGPCVLRRPFNPYLLAQALEASRRTYFTGLKGEKVPGFVMALSDAMSGILLNGHEWEMPLVKKMAAIVKAFPDTTFMDIGSNLGSYTVPIAAHGLKTISMDANFRVIIRVLLTLMVNGIESSQSKVLWNLVSKNNTQLEYINFPKVCDSGTGRKGAGGIVKDTIPIMPMASNRLASIITTKNVVLKIDVEGSEAGFFLTSGTMFKDFNFVAVLMEWRADLLGDANMKIIVEFFTSRSYEPIKGYVWTKLDTSAFATWHKSHGNSFEVLWVRKENMKQVMNATL